MAFFITYQRAQQHGRTLASVWSYEQTAMLTKHETTANIRHMSN